SGADLRDLAARLCLGGVAEERRRSLRLQVHVGRALAEAGGAALALERDAVRARLDDVRQLELALEAGIDRTDADLHRRGVLVLARALECLASGDRFAQHIRIIERGPGALDRGGDRLLSFEFHLSWLRGSPPLRGGAGVGWMRDAPGAPVRAYPVLEASPARARGPGGCPDCASAGSGPHGAGWRARRRPWVRSRRSAGAG